MMLFRPGSDEIQFRDFSGGSSGSGSTPTSPPDPLSSLAQQVKAAAEAAFFNQLGEGLAQEEPQVICWRGAFASNADSLPGARPKTIHSLASA